MSLSKKIAIDLGTANSVVSVVGEGVLVNEPSVVAVNSDDRRVLAVGVLAKDMVGKTPEGIEAIRPLRDGVIADFAITEAMLKYFIDKTGGKIRLLKPTVMISVPAGVTSVESRAVLEAAYNAGARIAYLIPEPLAAAIGAELPIGDPSGNMIINSGGGTTEVAVISLGGIVVSGSVRVAGNKIDEAIASYARRKYGLFIGEKTSEDIKINIGWAIVPTKEMEMEVKGRDTINGLPRTVIIKSSEIALAIEPTLKDLISEVKQVLERTPPELASDVIDRGIVMSGGTSKLRGIEKFVTRETGLPAHIADDPLLCVVKGISLVLENLEAFEKSIIRK
ncbi:rod shape-determining protein [Candidatus Parcubacteria bacterium]|nr:rod shape-determining protein [Patescibacteria group bacterium]MCG2689377.1 rod shape-determining protein [Candidatus Parcubacteria bacterium]